MRDKEDVTSLSEIQLGLERMSFACSILHLGIQRGRRSTEGAGSHELVHQQYDMANKMVSYTVESAADQHNQPANSVSKRIRLSAPSSS